LLENDIKGGRERCWRKKVVGLSQSDCVRGKGIGGRMINVTMVAKYKERELRYKIGKSSEDVGGIPQKKRRKTRKYHFMPFK